MKSSQFHIHANDSIQSIQDQFSCLFPSMQISFFRDPDKSRFSDQCVMYAPNVKIIDVNPAVNDFSIEISPYMRVTDLEKTIKSRGLHSQISCKILNRRSPESSVSNWYLKDVFNVDQPQNPNVPEIDSFLPSTYNSILK